MGRAEQVPSVPCSEPSGVASRRHPFLSHWEEQQACVLAACPTPRSLTVAREAVLLLEEAAQDEVDHVGGLVGALAQRPSQLLQVPLDVLLQEPPRVRHRRLDDVEQSLRGGGTACRTRAGVGEPGSSAEARSPTPASSGGDAGQTEEGRAGGDRSDRQRGAEAFQGLSFCRPGHSAWRGRPEAWPRQAVHSHV